MLDLLHFYFEEDNNYSSEEQMKSRSKVRENIYRDLYNTEYKYAVEETRQAGTSGATANFDLGDPLEDAAGDLKPFDPLAGPPKPYIPPTKFDPDAAKPFGNILDAPLG